jgi:hypothetical protein
MAVTLDEAIQETAADIAYVLNQTSGGQRETVRVDEISKMASEQVWHHILGLLRDRVPTPVPRDLMSVGRAGGLRIAKGMADTGAMLARAGEPVNEMEFRPWVGFMITERLILDRYRRTTA